MVAIDKVLFTLAGVVLVEATSSQCCAADKCFKAAKLPAEASPVVSAFCEKYINSTPGTITRTVSATLGATESTTPTVITVPGEPTTQIVTAPQETSYITETSGQPVSVSCTVTIAAAATFVNYPIRASPLAKRDVPAIPEMLSKQCNPKKLPQKISSACSCFLTSATTTITATQTQVYTIPAPTDVITGPAGTTVLETVSQDPITVVVTVTPDIPSTTCTSTSTVGGLTCGIPNPTAEASGSIVCPNVAPPTETNARFRIEGGEEGTIFEDCIASGPRNITTSSGGTHLCDGTNNGANPAPGSTLITQIDAAGMLDSFSYDGTFSTQFDDFFIERIAETTQTGDDFWGVLSNLAFTAAGGCEEYAPNGVEGLWAFNAFNVNGFLKLDPEYQVVRAGTSSVTLNVRETDGNGATLRPIAGATVVTGGGTSDSSGNVLLNVPPLPGCYQYKATLSGFLTSNAFYLTVLPPLE